MPRLPVWAVNPFSRENSVTCAVISMCIKEDFKQTLPQLADRLSKLKERPPGECLAVLTDMRKRGHLGFFDDEFNFNPWKPGKEKEKEKCEERV